MHRSMLIQIILGELLLFWVAQCDRDKSVAPPALPTGSIRIEARVANEAPATEPVAKVPVTQGRLRVSGVGMVTRDTLLTVQGGRLAGQLDQVPVGLRQVELFLLEVGGDTLWQGGTEVTVQANSIATAIILLERVGDQAPQASFSVSPELGGLRTAFRVQAQVDDTHDPTDSLQVRWDFENDGRFETEWNTGKDTTHVYGATGNYRIALEVRDRSGKTSSLTKQVQVIEPIAAAGDTLRVIPTGNLVTLDGRQSKGLEGQALVFHWSQVLDHPQGKQVSVMGTFTDNNTSTAGQVSFEPRAGRGLYVFTLTVEVAGIQSNPDTVYVWVVSARPTAQVETPAEIRAGEFLTLKGSASDSDDTVLQYRWRGEQLNLLSDTTITSPVFAPDKEGIYHYQLVAIDADPQESAPVEVAITVKPANRPPVANAGLDQEVELGQAVQLDGSASSDPDGETLSYQWAAPAGISLSSTVVPQPKFTANAVGVYRFILVVNDGQVDSPPDTVVVTVKEPVVEPPSNNPPVADAGRDTTAELGVTMQLDGRDSRDADTGDVLSYSWRQVSGPAVALQNADSSRPSFAPADSGVYLFELQVSDGTASAADEVVVTVKAPVMVPPANTPPVADAGPDQTVEVGVEVVMDGSGSSDADGDTLRYRWTAPAGISLSSAAVSQPRFTPATAGTYPFVLVVNDGHEDSPPDTVVVLVKEPVVEPPPNKLPVADAGVDQEVEIGVEVTLDGSSSSDPDSDALRYQWAASAGGNLSSTTEVRPRFTPSAAGLLQFLLVVNDGHEDSPPDTVVVLVKAPVVVPPANTPPVADAGPDQTVEVGVEVVMDGSGSSDADGDTLRYRWTAPAGISLSSAAVSQPRFTPATAGTYPFVLVVNDGQVDSQSDTVVVQVKAPVVVPPPNNPPVANAGPDQMVEVGTRVQLDGRSSQDTDEGNVLSYTWRQMSGPVVVLQGTDSSRPSFVPADSGRYVFELEVSDGRESDTDTVRVTVTQPVVEPPPPGNNAPVADAGPGQTVEVGQTIQLDGRGSSDPDGDQLTYTWTQISGPAVGEGRTATPVFVPAEPGVYVFSLVVSDGEFDSAPVEVVVTVSSPLRIVFQSDRDGDWEIYSINPDGSSITQLTSNPGDIDYYPQASPDGSKIVFTSNRDGRLDPFTGTISWDILTMNADGSSQQNVSNSPYQEYEPTWSPDGTKIAFASIRGEDLFGDPLIDIYTMDADGGNLVNLTQGVGRNSQPSWSPDGQKIAFTSIREDGSGNLQADIYTMNPNGGELSNLTRSPIEEGYPAWSPDGTKIAYAASPIGGVPIDIFVMNADGSNPVNLTQEDDFGDYAPSWSPDGKRIAFTSNRNRIDVYIMDADGSNLRLVVENGQLPSWLQSR